MRVVLVLGKAQQGKTTLALKLLQRDAVRLLTLDPVRSHPFSAAIARRDAQAFSTWTALSGFLAGDSASGNWRAILRSQDEADYVEALRNATFYRHVTILVDEGLWFVDSRDAYPWLKKAARANAHFGGGIGVPLWITAQRPSDLPPDIRSQATQVISFRQDEPRDLAFLAERFSPSFAEDVAALGNHRWAAFPPLNDGGNENASVGTDASLGSGGRRCICGADSAIPTTQLRGEVAPVGEVTGGNGEQTPD